MALAAQDHSVKLFTTTIRAGVDLPNSLRNLVQTWWPGLGFDGTGLAFEARFQECAQLALAAFENVAGGF